MVKKNNSVVLVAEPRKKLATFKSFSSKRRFGIEFEVSAKTSQLTLANLIKISDNKHDVGVVGQYQQDHNNNYWSVKFDRSCSDQYHDYGWEISSFVASGVQDLTVIEKVAKRLNDAGVITNKNCAFHIHVECREIDKQGLGNIQAWWLKFENVFLGMVSPYRYRGIYSKPLRSRFLKALNKTIVDGQKINTKTVYDTMLPSLGNTASGWAHKDRRTALNFCNMINGIDDVGDHLLAKRKTLELRLPEGTLDHENVRGWVKLFISFIESCVVRDAPTDFSSLSLEELLSFIGCSGYNHIPSKAMFDLKIWMLTRIITHSDRINLIIEAKNLLFRSMPNDKEALAIFLKHQKINNLFKNVSSSVFGIN